jgi:hypothetical protein
VPSASRQFGSLEAIERGHAFGLAMPFRSPYPAWRRLCIQLFADRIQNAQSIVKRARRVSEARFPSSRSDHAETV